MNAARRPIPPLTYLFFYALFATVLFLIHTPLLKLPYFWDEMGQRIPAVFGYSIAATRVAMLLVAAGGLLAVFLLAIRLSENLRGAPAFVVVMLLGLSPLYYAQSMLALPDVPAMLFTCLALLLFLQERPVAAAAAATALVVVILTWGNHEFTRYNLLYLRHPVRFPVALLRRLYYLFCADFRWIGTLGIILAAGRGKGVLRTRDWRITTSVVASWVLVFSVFGGDMLERYLLPVLPLVYMAMVAAASAFPRGWRLAAQFALAAGLTVGNFWNPPYPFPLENNTAFVDFVKLQEQAADFLEFNCAERRILTAWPLSTALSRPELGYVRRGLQVRQLPDFRATTLEELDWANADVLVLYSRNWDPAWNLLHIEPVRRFWEHYFDYEPDVVSPVASSRLVLEHAGHWARRGLWVDVYFATNRPN